VVEKLFSLSDLQKQGKKAITQNNFPNANNNSGLM
jgi:hypothetical protein